MKVGIVVSPDFFTNHVGVRNYVSSLHALLSKEARVDYLTCQATPSNRRQWHILQPPSLRLAADNFVAKSHLIEGSPLQAYHSYRKCADAPTPTLPTIPRLALGASLDCERYDVLLISAPWCVDFTERLPAPRVVGLAYDTIPNTIGFTTSDIRPFQLAGEHSNGYRYFREHCDLTLAISPDTAESLAALFSIPKQKIIALPPFLPAGYHGRVLSDVPRGRNLVLASPFDPRKGLSTIPAIVNATAHSLEKLFIYGKPRCHPDLVRTFFTDLDAKINVVWYLHATADAIVTLFSASRLLLFPSRQEGLGLPVLEAQLCGARVAARPISPIRENLLHGAVQLGDSPAENAERVAAVIADSTFDHTGLARHAAERFSVASVRAALTPLLAPSIRRAA